MPEYVIERKFRGADKLSPEQLQAISRKSCDVIRALGPKIQWVQSEVADAKMYCTYIAPDGEMLRKHTQMGEFSINRISRVRGTIGPTNAGVIEVKITRTQE